MNGRLVGLTPTGTYHISKLRLNRALLVQHAMEAIRYSQTRGETEAIVHRLEVLEARLDTLAAKLEALQKEQGEVDR